jgi:hypothetical protein
MQQVEHMKNMTKGRLIVTNAIMDRLNREMYRLEIVQPVTNMGISAI